MRKVTSIIVAMAAMVAVPAFADSTSVSETTTEVETSSQSGAISYGGGVNIEGSRAPTDTTIRNAPQVSAPGMSSGHPCAYAPLSGGLSIIGGGASLGGQKVDDACLLAQMGEKSAAISMIAARNPSACSALRANGVIAASSDCGDGRRGVSRSETPPSRPSGVSSRGQAFVRCERQSSGRIVVTIPTGGDKTLASQQCKAALGG